MRIVLIQDAFRHLKRALERQGYVVETAKADYTIQAADLIILNLESAGRHGLTLIREWRAAGVRTLVMVLTASQSPEDKVEALRAGADALVVEPYDLEELLARIRALLRRNLPADEESSIVRIFDLEISTLNRMVKRAGRSINLTRREYDLLLFLVRNGGHVVTRSQIWAHLTGEDGKSKSNVVDVYIRYLRKKIDKDFDLPLILTSWGQGYRLRGESELLTSEA
jgi:DNA-binding response OmpR family regulator